MFYNIKDGIALARVKKNTYLCKLIYVWRLIFDKKQLK